MLFNGSNLTASANDLERNDKKRSIVNHFIPFTEADVGADERFESNFMVEYMASLPSLPTPTPPKTGGTSQTLPQKSPSEEYPPHHGEVAKPEGSRLIKREVPGGRRGFSPEAQAVLDEGKKLWKAYFSHTDPHSVREEYKLNRADVGRYQIRNALKKRNESGDFLPVSFTPFEEAYKALSEKLRPQVFSYGFLKV